MHGIGRRRLIGVLGALACGSSLPGSAQQPQKVWRIGYLGAEAASVSAYRVEALRAGLRDLGYTEGKNVLFVFRWADGKYDQLPDLVMEIARLRADVLVTDGDKSTLAAKRAATALPIVGNFGDPVALGVVTSLARPGGNITGLAGFGPEIMAKRLELIKEVMPRVTRVVVLLNPANPAMGPILRSMEITARSLRVELQPIEVRNLDEIEGAFSTAAKRRVGAIVIQNETLFLANHKKIAELAVKKHIPSFGRPEFAEVGGLVGYGANSSTTSRRTATFVDKILKGAKPADLPVEQPMIFEFVVNMRTAKALGIRVPPTILLRATKVIE